MARLGRRDFLALAATVTSGVARGASPTIAGFELLDLRVEGAGDLSRRAWVLVPDDLDRKKPARVLLLWHGLGETTNERAGVGAWVERYGLVTSNDRLSHPPLRPISRRADLVKARADEISEAIERRPYGGHFIFVCPYTPNIWKTQPPRVAMDRLAHWVESALLPRVGDETHIDVQAQWTGVDGCSLGGLLSFGIFLRRPALFRSCGGVQAAIGDGQAVNLASELATAVRAHPSARVHIETSRADPFFAANLALSRELRNAGVAHDLSVSPGPHDQPWLREVGTLEMLLWHDRALAEGGS
jgi:hypothetical protein